MIVIAIFVAAVLLHAAAGSETVAARGVAAPFANPVIDRDFPDPCILRVGKEYFAYATNSGGVNVQVARSTDLIHWKTLPDAMRMLPPWARPGWTWAPEVCRLPDQEQFTLYFAARDRQSGRQCIGAAAGWRAEGPFASDAKQPLIAQVDLGGSIDPCVFVDDDKTAWLLWKNDGNAIGQKTWIFLQRLSADGQSLAGERHRLLTADQSWEGGLIEAPTLVKRNEQYLLFYSANSYACERYAIGYAVSESLTGPYTKPSSGPWKQSKERCACGPGGQSLVVTPAGEMWLAYHSWDEKHRYRAMQIERVFWRDGKPVCEGAGAQRAPKLEPDVLAKPRAPSSSALLPFIDSE